MNGERWVDEGAPEPYGGPEGTGPPTDFHRRPPPRRWAWTLVFAGLVPAGAVLLVAGGGPYGYAVLRIVGGSMLGVAAVMVLWLLAGRDDEDGRNGADGDGDRRA